jgi:hypothetical protein
MTKKTTKKEERFILSHSFRGFIPWWLAPLFLGMWWAEWSRAAHFMEVGKKRDRGGG